MTPILKTCGQRQERRLRLKQSESTSLTYADPTNRCELILIGYHVNGRLFWQEPCNMLSFFNRISFLRLPISLFLGYSII